MKNKKDEQGLNVLKMFGATNDNTGEKIPQNIPPVNDIVQPQTDPIAGGETYKAFNSNNTSQPQLEIRLKGNRGKWLYYPFIISAEYEGNESITLVYQGTSYIIKGRNFSRLKDHFRTQTIEYIQEFDPSQFKALPSPELPLIEEIEIVEAGGELEE
jgi:hypothetical protein